MTAAKVKLDALRASSDEASVTTAVATEAEHAALLKAHSRRRSQNWRRRTRRGLTTSPSSSSRSWSGRKSRSHLATTARRASPTSSHSRRSSLPPSQMLRRPSRMRRRTRLSAPVGLRRRPKLIRSALTRPPRSTLRFRASSLEAITQGLIEKHQGELAEAKNLRQEIEAKLSEWIARTTADLEARLVCSSLLM